VPPIPAIAFVIPVRNDAPRLRDCLESIRSNRFPADLVEIVVVDHGSSDESSSVARAAGAHVVELHAATVAALRNRGAALSRAPLIAFVDADHVLAPGWIAAAVEIFESDESIAATGELCRAPEPGTWVQQAYGRLRGRRSGRRRVEWLGAGNLAIRRSAFEAVGGFDETLATCEDVDLCKKLRRAGLTLVADDRLHNVHVGDPATLDGLFRGELWRGRSNLAVSLRPPITLRELPSAIIPAVQLGSLTLTAAAVTLGSGIGPTASFALAAVLLPAGARAARMGVDRDRHRVVRELAANVVVALVYDAARALSLIAFSGHRVRRR
jgi:glycosyl transferase family 2